MNLFTTGLHPKQLRILEHTGSYLARQLFYLAGGTCVSLYFGHRRSVDLGWFTGQTISDPLGLAQRLREAGLPFTTLQTPPGTLHGQFDNVRASFLEFRYPLLQPLVPWPEAGCLLASLDDLACMKLSAIAQRGSRKDFIDLYAMIHQYMPLSEMLALYRQKYSVQDITPVLYGLAYFDDADEEPMPEMIWDLGWPAIRRAFEGWIREIGKSGQS